MIQVLLSNGEILDITSEEQLQKLVWKYGEIFTDSTELCDDSIAINLVKSMYDCCLIEFNDSILIVSHSNDLYLKAIELIRLDKNMLIGEFFRYSTNYVDEYYSLLKVRLLELLKLKYNKEFITLHL